MSIFRKGARLKSLASRLPSQHESDLDSSPPLRLVKSRALEQVLNRDRIVRGLLKSGVAGEQEVYTAWAFQQDYRDERPLWRILADVDGTDSTRILRFAAGCYSFREIAISVLGTQVLVTQNRRLFADWQWRKMVELGVFPVREKNDPLDGKVRWIMASFDPARASVRSFADSVAQGRSVLGFAPPAIMFDVVTKCTGFPKLHALPWYRKYVLGRLPIALRALPDSGDLRRVA